MKTLMLLRHAKSSWSEPDLSDHDRPLIEKGKKAAIRMGALLVEKGLVPDLILSSTARRARKTAKLAAKASGFSGEIQLLEDLYLASAGELLAEARAHAPEAASRLLVVAHNPGLEDLVGILSGRHERFPTAALAIFEVSIDSWNELEPGVPFKLTAVFRPKNLF
jgi:phosphohistidine phosphatase